ncbi:MAG: hypothetical protein JSW71_10360 [Gemmatimonadota bacterium]|nr:MAG: hypothetical protein JSW71_10360 [Gemmatimonadota bacterium]
MALPAQVGWVVRCEIDLRDSSETLLSVTGTAEVSLGGLAGPHRPRVYLMFVRSLVARGTRDRGVVRHGLLACDLAVTSAAVAWHSRRFGRMWLVAGYARNVGVVIGRIDLRESGRTRGVVLVTQGTELPVLWCRRLHLQWVGHVVGSRSVAHFAPDATVVSGKPHLLNLAVAERALLVASIFLLVSYNRIRRRRPIMTDITERVRNQQTAGNHECDGGCKKYG